MMRARYVLPFDDLCPTVDWRIWERIETILNHYRVKPILAVVPDNCDPNLQICPPRADFWQWVRGKQKAGWSIGLHGYQHVYETSNPGLLGINQRSEFAGLPFEEQKKKVQKAVRIFRQHGVHPDVFVAPAHSFDRTTLAALSESGIGMISDGFFLKPLRWLDRVWVPQQMWRLRNMPFGIPTVCYHHHRMAEAEVLGFARDVERFHSTIVSLREAINMTMPDAKGYDIVFGKLWGFAVRLKRRIRDLVRTGG